MKLENIGEMHPGIVWEHHKGQNITDDDISNALNQRNACMHEIDNLFNIYPNFELNIYSRYGNLIYQGSNNDVFWNGIANKGIAFNNQLVPTGVYFYVLHLNDPQYPNQFIGNVYINY